MAEATTATLDDQAPVPAKRRKLLLLVVAALVLAGGGGAAYYFLAGGKPADADAHAPAPAAEPIYVALEPPFVVNFESGAAVRFLQVAVQAMTRDAQTADLLKRHDPAIRNALLMLLAGQRYEALASRDGKDALRDQALAEVRRVVKEQGGDGAKVEALYFTSFVMQ